MLNENDLSVLDWNLNRIITLITDYGCLYSPDMSRLKLLQKNINIFSDYELSIICVQDLVATNFAENKTGELTDVG